MRDTLSRREFIRTAGKAAVGAIAFPSIISGCGRQRTPGLDHPNIVIALYDATRADHLACHGYHRATSPNIDKLAQRGIQFTRHFAQANVTKHSTVADFSGHYLPSVFPMVESDGPIGTTFGDVPFDVSSFVEAFQEAGYDTTMIAHIPYVYSIGPEIESDDFVNIKGFNRIVRSFHATPLLMLEQVSEVIEASEEPFLIYAHFTRPHAGYNPIRRCDLWADPFYDGIMKRKEEQFGHDAMWSPDNFNPLDVTRREDLEYVIAKYDGNIREADESLGKLVKLLDSLASQRDYVLVVKSDHGETMQDRSLHIGHSIGAGNELLNTPLIVYVPDMNPGKIDAPTQNIDIAPTLLQLAQIQEDFGQGTSLIDLLNGRTHERPVFATGSYTRIAPEDPVPIEFGKTQPVHCVFRNVKGRFYKLIVPENADEQLEAVNRHELYDLTDDPGEKRNLRDSEPEVRDILANKLHRWLEGQKEIARGGTPASIARVEIDRVQEEKLRALGYVR